jgi:hypothetical protein
MYLRVLSIQGVREYNELAAAVERARLSNGEMMTLSNPGSNGASKWPRRRLRVLVIEQMKEPVVHCNLFRSRPLTAESSEPIVNCNLFRSRLLTAASSTTYARVS